MDTGGERDYGVIDRPALRRNERVWTAAVDRVRSPASRSEMAAQQIAAIVRKAGPRGRLGTKEELRTQCGVSVGTLNEALRLLQARGLVTVRPGPGGGLFADEPAPAVRLGNLMLALESDQASTIDAVRIRNAFDPLVVSDAVRHASAADIAALRRGLGDMATSAISGDGIPFLHANCAQHARIAAISPSALLGSIYIGLLDVIEAHTLAVFPSTQLALPAFLIERHRLHVQLVDAIAGQDHPAALRLLGQLNAAEF